MIKFYLRSFKIVTKNEKAFNHRIDAPAYNGIGSEPPSGLGSVRKIR